MPHAAPDDGHDLVVVANRLPVDVALGADGAPTWTRAPGGLVTALSPVMSRAQGAWVGWGGTPDLVVDPFQLDDIQLVPVMLTTDDVAGYYEGFANDTLWPLYHDVITPPTYHREWWEDYRRVNERFAQAAAQEAAAGGIVWVHDYQLQLVPAMLRALRPDVRIGYFSHIPFPPLELFAQLPWRRQVLEGLLGADLLGFQRGGDAANFVRAVRRLTDLTTHGQQITVGKRHVRAQAFGISIDSRAFDALARTPEVHERARLLRHDLGDPQVLLLGVDRLDYTKGIRHRLKAYGELLADGRLSAETTTLVQVASPSRENVGAYQQLRDEVELLVGRINGEFGTVGHAPVQYLHQSFPMDEMAALYLAADVMLVTALRDGMNLVAKEYVAARSDERGALVLSEFTGAADELSGALLINPHDIAGTKDAIVRAAHIEPREARKRMRRLRRRVLGHDVATWSEGFLAALREGADGRRSQPSARPADLVDRLRALAADRAARPLLIALDFDGTLSPLQDDPSTSRLAPGGEAVLARLAARPDVTLALVSGRAMDSLAALAPVPEGTVLVAGHGAERARVTAEGLDRRPARLTDEQSEELATLRAAVERVTRGREGVWVESKPTAVVLHTRLADRDVAAKARDEALALGTRAARVLAGKDVVELLVLPVDKGTALTALRAELGTPVVLYAGDDATDENAFVVLGPDDVTVKVGPGQTRAAHRVADPAALVAVLGLLADALEAGVPVDPR